MSDSKPQSPVQVAADGSHLKDFQQATADYVFARLFGDGDLSTSRFLVADEVGLGKTVVAREVITQTIEHLQSFGDGRVDIVYICSNQAIAQQNLRKLAPNGIEPVDKRCRLSLLPFDLGEVGGKPVNLVALTPGTSLKLGNSGGTLDERAALLAALIEVWGGHRLRGYGVLTLFAGDDRVGDGGYDSKEDRIRAEAKKYRNKLSDRAKELFMRELQKIDAEYIAEYGEDVDSRIHSAARDFKAGSEGDIHRLERAGRSRRQILKRLREAMATTGAQLLQPDIVVLDEFQRFRDVLHADEDDDSSTATPEDRYAASIAKHLLSFDHVELGRKARVLLLSATPYAMHTSAAHAHSDEMRERPPRGSNEHYDDFLATYRFLAEGLPGGVDPRQASDALSKELFTLRRAISDAPSSGVAPAIRAADEVSDRLREVMVRTERLSATDDRDGMLVERDRALPVSGTLALKQYLSAADIAAELAGENKNARAGEIVSYWKVAPYTLSYLDSYKVLENLQKRIGPEAPLTSRSDQRLAGKLERSPAVLPWSTILHYGEVPPSNAGLEQLWRDFFDDARAERLLWLPPSLPYYRAGGDFETDAARKLTKRLIFSAWNVAPTAIATLTSYECERRLSEAAAKAGKPVYEYSAKRRSGQLLRFRPNAQSLPHLLFELTFPELARISDPLKISADLRSEGVPEPTLDQILTRATEHVEAALNPLLSGREVVTSGHDSTAWYPLAAAMLDENTDNILWQFADESVEISDEIDPDTPGYLGEHLGKLHDLLEDDATLPPVPADVVRIVALTGIASPSSVLYRSLRRSFESASEEHLLRATREGAGAFRHMFNLPHANQVISAFGGDGDLGVDSAYWRKTLQYCAVGNLQSVIDEYVGTMIESSGLNRGDPDEAVVATVEALRGILQLRTTSYRPSTMTSPDGADLRWQQVSMRGGFALRFATDGHQEADGRRGPGEVSSAFNSPFWPFVLASTSVGQEGLDFHLYSHAISHWNLPNNPVDLEQREGRVHRYKCHAVRKNVAQSVPFPSGDAEPWQQMFESAENACPPGTSHIVPYWVYAPSELGENAAKIERHLPIAPYTREMSIKGPLLASVSVYRMAFGQPRQDELLKYVLAETDEELKRALARVRIDLTPPTRPGH